jgi:hypothetical protein
MTTYDSYKGVPLDKLAKDVKWWEYCNGGCSMSLSNRLWEIHEETRWVSVCERMPTEEDGDWLFVIRHSDVQISHMDDMWGVSHFKRIDKPEGV